MIPAEKLLKADEVPLALESIGGGKNPREPSMKTQNHSCVSWAWLKPALSPWIKITLKPF
jgi:hypothetical protein